MPEPFKMPTWEEFARSIARSYLDCQRHLGEAQAIGNRKEATGLRKLVARQKRLMDKNGITIRE